MIMWAILSGIEGNLAAYNAVMTDIYRQSRNLEAVYILGDVVGATPESEAVMERIRNPQQGEFEPLVCKGWWEEQCLILYGLGAVGEPTELLVKYGGDTVKALAESVSRDTVQWIRGLDFGFFELDCLLLHGSPLGVEEELTPETPAILMCDRISRMQANNLFCGRSGLTFNYQLQAGSINSTVTTLDIPVSTQTLSVTTLRQIIGVGNVGRIPGKVSYTLYHPTSNKVEFKQLSY
ncbi:metallophosphatase [Brunnivagina elsteri]|uniref:Metallophosphatase n=1 Tax=Brunnivagina elsteri CCALA 953 TaxID=987040 RepID=A0A2A2TBT6_9CYAN|nr:metallophosphatase [Calothrix elsteri]PAX49105.1 metallophosphatase [Calothrix elsteri CCALA 953]